ncbi:hypothetical protein ZWY2020_041048 [Hordeum vulgare]|nr:hypothetical protein ZWY2020_041048 [Hordeum vulgare]
MAHRSGWAIPKAAALARLYSICPRTPSSPPTPSPTFVHAAHGALAALEFAPAPKPRTQPPPPLFSHGLPLPPFHRPAAPDISQNPSSAASLGLSGPALGVSGPALYWRYKKGSSASASAPYCPPCSCDCPPPLSLHSIVPSPFGSYTAYLVQYSDGVTFFRVQRSKIVLISSSTAQSLGSAEEEHQQHGQRSSRN